MRTRLAHHHLSTCDESRVSKLFDYEEESGNRGLPEKKTNQQTIRWRTVFKQLFSATGKCSIV